MPTVKPRITITLTDHQHTVLAQLAQVQKVSMSSIVVDLVDTTLPVLERLAVVLQNAAAAPQSVLEDLRRSLTSAEAALGGVQDVAFGQLEELVQASGGAVSGDAQAAPGAGVPAPKPPTSNRGVRNVPPDAKNDPISPMKTRKKHGGRE